MTIVKKIGQFFDRVILPDSDRLMKRLQKKKDKTNRLIIKNTLSKNPDLRFVIMDSYTEKGFISIFGKDYDNLIKGLKERKSIAPINQEDGIKKDMMLSFYTIDDSKGNTWFLVIDVTNSPNIGLRDYWKIKKSSSADL